MKKNMSGFLCSLESNAENSSASWTRPKNRIYNSCQIEKVARGDYRKIKRVGLRWAARDLVIKVRKYGTAGMYPRTFCKYKYKHGKCAKSSQHHASRSTRTMGTVFSIKRSWCTTTRVVALGSNIASLLKHGVWCYLRKSFSECYDMMFLSDYLIVHLQVARFNSLTYAIVNIAHSGLY